ncbi:E3 ubiquitin-protein like [Actinidia chinensis var. chinensis]|uniref:U-box domain-containing protein n=1 Tax=Actinidia chinensis var. chinensis TaxID=1590841 RepID=A0A2R6QL19_ACTCC|nr:E3 ubiquitin-protein like [Actinidia chinensis var. chinensis]
MEIEKKPHNLMDFPQHFRCPISMELMKDPVTISTGVTYERKSIEKWLFSYKKTTCPTTMQSIDNYTITPNHTLKRLILSWEGGNSHQSSPPPPPSSRHDELISLLNTVESTPFKVSSLKKLKSIIEMGDEIKQDFKRNGGVQMVLKIVMQILDENPDFIAFRACEEALGVLHQLSLSEEDEKTMKLFSKPDLMKAMAVMLQRGSTEARFYTISIFQKMVMVEFDWSFVIQDQGMDFFKSILELVSDEICTKASSCALQVLIEILSSSKKSRLKAIEAGAICILIELLPDSNRSKCEKIMELIKLLCECAEGRLGFVEHGLGIAAISKKMLNVSNCATKIGVKILWLICNFHPSERVLEEILVFGGVKKIVALLHIDGRSSTKDKVVKILKLHGSSWRRYPCFPSELKDYLGLKE